MTDRDDPAWPLIQQWSAEASNPHRLLPAGDEAGEATLASLDGVTEWSALGALARHAAALVIDDWLVVLGAGGGGYPGLRELNGPDASAPLSGGLLVGIDVMGGGFAINAGGLPCEGAEVGKVCYLGPDDARWMATELGHSEFVHWALTGDVDGFYADLRWPSWRDDVKDLAPGQGISSYPPPWSVEGQEGDVDRRAVPLQETFSVLLTTSQQLD